MKCEVDFVKSKIITELTPFVYITHNGFALPLTEKTSSELKKLGETTLSAPQRLRVGL